MGRTRSLRDIILGRNEVKRAFAQEALRAAKKGGESRNSAHFAATLSQRPSARDFDTARADWDVRAVTLVCETYIPPPLHLGKRGA